MSNKSDALLFLIEGDFMKQLRLVENIAELRHVRKSTQECSAM